MPAETRRAPRLRRAPGRPVLTGRAMLLGAVIVLLVVLLAAPVHRYLASREQVSDAAHALTADRAEYATLHGRLLLWSDPGYIERLARTRLEYAMPGDIVYRVKAADGRSTIDATSGVTAKKAAGPAWNDRLWDSVRAAGK